MFLTNNNPTPRPWVLTWLGRDRRFILHLCLLFLVLPFALRYAFYYDLPLHPDEAYYWTWTQRLSWSYYDHPPMVAWLPQLLAGDGSITGLDLRLLANVCGLITIAACAYLLFTLTNSRTVVLRFGYAMLFVPVVFLNASIWTPDAPLVLFLALTMLSFHRAYTGAIGNWHWLGCGLWFGCALLAKYNAILWGGAILLWVLFTPRGREHILHSGKPWLAVGLACLLFAPVLWWNLRHENSSFYYQWDHLLNVSAQQTQPAFYFALVLAGVVLALGPALLLRFVVSARFARGAAAYLVSVALLPLVVLLLVATYNKIEVNWLIFSAYLLFVLFFFLEVRDPRYKRSWLIGHHAFHVTLMVVIWAGLLVMKNPSFNSDLVTSRFLDYDAIHKASMQLQRQHPTAVLMGRSYADHAVLSYASGTLLPYLHLTGRPNHYTYLNDPVSADVPIIVGSFRHAKPPDLSAWEGAQIQDLTQVGVGFGSSSAPRLTFYLITGIQ